MTEDDPIAKTPIERPKRFPKNRGVRAAVKAAAGSIPYAGAVAAEIADAVVPDHEARDRTRWEGEVTDGVNDLHGRVGDIDQRTSPRTRTLQGPAALAAKYMIERCPDGLCRDDVTIADLHAAYPDLTKEDIVDALGDLEALGLIESLSFIGAPPDFRLTQAGYEALDGPVLGWDTNDDARAVAALVVRQRENIRSAELEAELGWSRRRFNPALQIVIDFIDRGRVSQAIQADYVTPYFSPNNAELAELRHFVAGE